jgi:hypothetical protein
MMVGDISCAITAGTTTQSTEPVAPACANPTNEVLNRYDFAADADAADEGHAASGPERPLAFTAQRGFGDAAEHQSVRRHRPSRHEHPLRHESGPAIGLMHDRQHYNESTIYRAGATPSEQLGDWRGF